MELYFPFRHRLDYLKEAKNYFDIISVVLVFLIIPFRIINHDVQWFFASLAFLVYCLKSFEYAVVNR